VNRLAIDENFPDGWNVTQMDNRCATFRPAAAQWLWLSAPA